MGKSCRVYFDEGKSGDGYIEIRPVLCFRGHFNRHFAFLFEEYVKEKICSLAHRDVFRLIPSSDPAPDQEVAE